MYILDPLYSNNAGSAFTIKHSSSENNISPKVQFLMGDIAILMDSLEIKGFLSVIRSAKKECQTENCTCQNSHKTIKCNTPRAEIILKVTPTILADLEELILGVLFFEEYNHILSFYEIIPFLL